MEDSETPRMRKYVESKTTRIMMATVRHVTSSSGLRKFQADGFLFDGVYKGAYQLFYMLESVQLLEKQIFWFVTLHRLVNSYRR